MEKLMEILTDIRPDVEFAKETSLIDSSILDSFDIITIVGELNDGFDIDISAVDLVPENFNSVDAMWKLIQSKQ